MCKDRRIWPYVSFIITIRVAIIAALSRLGVGLPFIVLRNARDIHEYIALSRSLNLKRYTKFRPIFYNIINQIILYFPNVSVKHLMTISILLVDILAALLLYRISNHISRVTKDDEKRIDISETAQILYNYGGNADGYKYFLLCLSIYLSWIASGSDSKPSFKTLVADLVLVLFILNSSYTFLTVVIPIVYLRVYKQIHITDGSITREEIFSILKRILPSIFFIFSMLYLLKYSAFPHLENPYRTLDVHPSVDYSFHWYINELLPIEFIKASIFRNHVAIFLYPIPLLIALRKRPFAYLIIMSSMAIISQNELTPLGITIILILLSIQYQLLEKTQPFSKLALTIIVLMCISMFSYTSWIGRYMANPNYYFGPQILVLVLICIIIEDYTKLSYFQHIYCDPPSTALNLAVENNWGGSDSEKKKDDLIQHVINFCISRKEVYRDEIEDILVDKLDEYFFVTLEDGSDVDTQNPDSSQEDESDYDDTEETKKPAPREKNRGRKTVQEEDGWTRVI
ncbi:hypothetical protein BEWA_014670 [Theileria equi strain WA]|uniref:GPI transamidase subunit PIG-U n=1 Tax=Theileria equi strain WA TaxID=1537102 RepID=L1LCM2_THEEQ|nr:hypothetical protein BEWA_014670 [Theileria equi strain WA]EKX72908.1 hypothetical protein BEWA_014670 [Theileria equi strain WA]|eukprot:XP_004832360.1 hypothetical protein BEWA_014670 [Theileria equi strain WA]